MDTWVECELRVWCCSQKGYRCDPCLQKQRHPEQEQGGKPVPGLGASVVPAAGTLLGSDVQSLRNAEGMEKVQGRATRMITGLQNSLGLISPPSSSSIQPNERLGVWLRLRHG